MPNLLFISTVSILFICSNANVEKPPLTTCIGDERFVFLLHTAFESMKIADRATEKRSDVDWEPVMHDLDHYEVTKIDVKKFFRFQEAVNTVAASYLSIYDRLADNDTMIQTTTRAPARTTPIPKTTPAPSPSPGWTFFSWRTFGIAILIVGIIVGGLASYYFWKRANGQNFALIDLLPLVNNVVPTAET